MEKDKKVWIFIGVVILLIVILLIVKANGKKGNGEVKNIEQSAQQEEHVNVLADGTKVNTSNKLAETKTIDGLEVSNIRLTEKNNVSRILATVNNPTSQEKGGFAVKITLLTKDGSVLKELEAYLDKVLPGEQATLNTAATVDFANAYDFKIEKK